MGASASASPITMLDPRPCERLCLWKIMRPLARVQMDQECKNTYNSWCSTMLHCASLCWMFWNVICIRCILCFVDLIDLMYVTFIYLRNFKKNYVICKEEISTFIDFQGRNHYTTCLHDHACLTAMSAMVDIWPKSRIQSWTTSACWILQGHIPY